MEFMNNQNRLRICIMQNSQTVFLKKQESGCVKCTTAFLFFVSVLPSHFFSIIIFSNFR